MVKKTALYSKHIELQGKIVDFAGFLLPVQYPSGIREEHRAVRTAAGLFDVSHMGEFLLEGKDALANLQYLFTSGFTKLPRFSARYTLLCNEDGGVIDDLLVYHLEKNRYLLVVNASNIEGDFKFIQKNLKGEVKLSNISDKTSLLALQGPRAINIVQRLCNSADIPEKGYTFRNKVKVGSAQVLLSRTGYTGEDGFELYFDEAYALSLFNEILEAGKPYGLLPCGLGARDTLRIEAAMPLYGHELSEEITPFEAALGRSVRLQKENFIGKASLEAAQEPKRMRLGFHVLDRGIPREGAEVFCRDKKVGFVCSGTMAPSLNKAIAMAMIDRKYWEETVFYVDVKGRKLRIEKCELPFYKRS